MMWLKLRVTLPVKQNLSNQTKQTKPTKPNQKSLELWIFELKQRDYQNNEKR